MSQIILIILLGFAVGANAQIQTLNPRLQDLPSNNWVKLHTSNDKSWKLQGHAGVVYDSKRGTIVMFGSDTHKINWDNSVREFSPFSETWKEHYPSAKPNTYRLDEQGHAIAGPENSPQPWAMHTFDAMVYDPMHDQLVVSSAPEHQQGKLQEFKNPRPNTKVTWLYSLADRRWSILPNEGHNAPVTFAGAITYDEQRDAIFLYANREFAELGPARDRWIKGKGPHIGGIHSMLEYDNHNHKILSFGGYKGSDKIWAYTPGDQPGMTGRWKWQQDPAGDSLPADEHYPVAFDVDQGVFLLVPDGAGKAETYVYDYSRNRVTYLPGAVLPGKLGMNYKMVYDRYHKVFLLITGNWKYPATVWALRLVVP